MLFRKYHIVIFKEGQGEHRNLLLRGWLGAGLFLLIALLAGGNIYFFKYFAKSKHLESQLTQSEKIVEEQNAQLVNIGGKLRIVEADMARVQEFNSKLRSMMSLDREPLESSPSPSSREDDFTRGYLPLLRQELLARKMNIFLKQLASEANLEEVKQQELIQVLRKNSEILAATPSIWPTEGFISSSFGVRPSPFMGKREFHKGIDINTRPGTPVQAPAKGMVSMAEYDGSYGNCVIVSHGNGLSTRYGHMQKFIVKKGDVLTRGDIIGYVGSSGRTTGPHLHYEVMINGVCVNPMRYILN